MIKTELPNQVIAYLQRNGKQPHICIGDIIELMNVRRAAVVPSLADSIAAGVLQIVNDGGEVSYARGPRFPSPALATATLTLLRPAAAETTKRQPRRFVTPPDLSKVKVDNDVPMPAKLGTGTDYSVLLRRLTKPGQSAELPLACRATLAKHITDAHKAGKARYTLRTMSETALRVWRTE